MQPQQEQAQTSYDQDNNPPLASSTSAPLPQPAISTTPAINTKAVYPEPQAHVDPTAVQEEWKPNTRLASRIPALRNYGIVLICGSIFSMIVSQNIWKFSRAPSAKMLGIIIYSILGMMMLSGIVLLTSKSKMLIQFFLNILFVGALLALLSSLLSLSILSIIFNAIVLAAIINIKSYVKAAA